MRWRPRSVYERIQSIRYQKGEQTLIKRLKYQSLEFADWFVTLKKYYSLEDSSKNKLVVENAVAYMKVTHSESLAPGLFGIVSLSAYK